MTAVEKILACAQEADEARKSVMDLVKEFIVDTSIPLSDRWEVFSKIPSSFFDVDRWYWDGDDVILSEVYLEPSFYLESLYYRRGETVDNVQMVENLKERGWLCGDDEDKLKEAILSSGIRLWKLDW